MMFKLAEGMGFTTVELRKSERRKLIFDPSPQADTSACKYKGRQTACRICERKRQAQGLEIGVFKYDAEKSVSAYDQVKDLNA